MLLVSALFNLIAGWLPWRRRPRVVALRHDPSLVKLAEPHGEPYSNPADDQADEDEEEEDEEDGEDAIEVAPRKHVKAAAKPAQKRKDGYEFPSARAARRAKARRSRRAVDRGDSGECHRARKRARRLRRARRDHQRASGPGVTLYELEPAPGHQVIACDRACRRHRTFDEQVSARVRSCRGRNAIGIELPNPKREKVLLRELLAASDYCDSQARLPLCLGKTIGAMPSSSTLRACRIC